MFSYVKLNSKINFIVKIIMGENEWRSAFFPSVSVLEEDKHRGRERVLSVTCLHKHCIHYSMAGEVWVWSRAFLSIERSQIPTFKNSDYNIVEAISESVTQWHLNFLRHSGWVACFFMFPKVMNRRKSTVVNS